MNASPQRCHALRGFAVAACLFLGATDPSVAEPAGEVPSLHGLADFPIGVAVPAGDAPNSLLRSPERQALVKRHFDSLTAENIMKMAYLQPQRERFEFRDADALVDYAQRNGLQVHGHALVWHTQAPAWMNEFRGSRAEFVALLREHVHTVAAHFAGRVKSWDVVNEAFEDQVPTEYRETIWLRNIGPEYLEIAFREARAADPLATLYYNDYDVEGAIGPAKLERILAVVDELRGRGVPIDGIGFQMHIDTELPSLPDLRAACAKVVQRGLKLRISELDVAVNQSKRYTALTPEVAALQRERYTQVVRAYLESVPAELRGGITLWGITDGDSWVPGFRKRADWPLLFDAQFRAKPALGGMAEGLAAGGER